MALIVEDGTGLSTAESYISVADFKAYCDAHGLSYAGKTDPQIEQALRRATVWIDATYASRFPGFPASVTQTLEWPRSDVVYRGEDFDDDVVPVQIERATCEAAHRELTSPGALAPDVTPGKVKKRVKVEGIEVEYADGSVAGQLLIIGVIAGILSPILLAATGSTTVSTLMRL